MATAFEAAGIMERQQSLRGIRVVLACTELLNCESLKRALDQQPDICIVGEATDWKTLEHHLDDYVPEVVLLGHKLIPEASAYFTGVFPLLVQVGEFASGENSRIIASLPISASVEQIVETVQAIRVSVLDAKWKDVMQMLQASRTNASYPRFIGTIEITSKTGPEVIPVADICCITAAKNYVRLETTTGEFQTRIPISEIAARLDPRKFIRIHRSVIVKRDEIETIVRREGYCTGLTLRNGRRYPIGSTYRRSVAQDIGVESATPDSRSTGRSIY